MKYNYFTYINIVFYAILRCLCKFNISIVNLIEFLYNLEAIQYFLTKTLYFYDCVILHKSSKSNFMVILRSFLCKIDKNNIARQKQNHIARTWFDSKRWSAEVFASFHFSLSRCYLSTCGCTNKHMSHSSEHRGRPSNHHRPREAYVHTLTMRHHCHVTRDKRSRSRLGAMNRQVANFQGKTVLGGCSLDYVLSFLGDTVTRKSPKRSNARNARVLRTTLRRKWRRRLISFAFYLSFLYGSINFLFSSDADQFAVRPHLFRDPFFSASLLRDGVWATPFLLDLNIYISLFFF